MKYEIKTIAFLLLSLLAFAGCKSDDTDFGNIITESKDKPIEITFPLSYLTEEPDEAPDSTSIDYNDYIESFKPSKEILIDFANNEATVTNPSEKVKITKTGAHVTANIGTVAVKFVLSGKTDDGSLTIEGDNRCEIEFNNLQLTNPSGAAVNNQSSKTLYVLVADGTVNSLVAKGGNELVTNSKGCLFSEGQISFSGSGILKVESSYRNAIASDDYILVRPMSKIDISCSTGNGIKANDGVTIKGGTINIMTTYDGAKGINSEDNVSIKGGLITIINTGTSRIDEVPVSAEYPEGIDIVSCAGIKSDGDFIINGGEVQIQCTGNSSKGINTDFNYIQRGGVVKVVTLGKKELASPKAIKADGSIYITGGYLYAYSLYSLPLDADGTMEVYNYKTQKTYLIEAGE